MALLHFVTLGALIFAPIFIIFKSSRQLSQNVGSSKSVNQSFFNLHYGVVAYVITLFLKMLCVATFFPSDHYSSSVISDVTLFKVGENQVGALFSVYDLVRILLCLLDFVSMCFLFGGNIVKLFGGSDEPKAIGVALGWTTAENVLNRLLPLFLSSVTSKHAVEFDFDWLRGAIHANLSLYLNIALAASVLLFSKRRETITGLLSVLIALLPFVSQVLTRVIVVVTANGLTTLLGSDQNLALAIHGVLVTLVCFIVFNVFKLHLESEASAKKQK